MTRVIPGTHKDRKLEENALTTWYMGLFGLTSEVVKLWICPTVFSSLVLIGHVSFHPCT